MLASPLVGVSNDALVLIRRGGAEAAALHGRSSAGFPGDLSAEDLRLCRAFRQRFERLAGAATAALARAALRADRRRARLRPRRARPVGRAAPLREHAQARPARALVRGAARPRHRGLRPLRPRPGGGRRARARGGRRGGGRRRRAAADDPLGQGARVQGRRRRRRRPRPDAPVARRDPLPAGRALRLPRRRPGDGLAPPGLRVRARCARPSARPSAPSGCASTTSR